MSNFSVLVDLSLAYKGCGYSGIPQDARLLFSTLTSSPQISSTGLIMNSDLPRVRTGLDGLLNQSVFLGYDLEHNYQSNIQRVLQKLFGRFYLPKFCQMMKSNFSLYGLNKSVDFHLLWRLFFQSTIPVSEFDKLASAQYVLTDLSLNRIANGLRQSSLNTRNFDFVIFQDSRNVRVSKGTQKIIRYHDGIPLFAPDTYNVSWLTSLHYKSVVCCENDSAYVCNSVSAQNDLSKISPKAAENSCVIPYVLPQLKKTTPSLQILMEIAFSKISRHTIEEKGVQKSVTSWFTNDQKKLGIPKYILTLSTIEPRKNHVSLIDAWRKLRFETGEDIKLLIVGKPGWKCEQILSAIRPFVQLGKILHLENIFQDDLTYLYSAANCFVFPSFSEGFGLPPCEAMQCGCPVVLSDISAHRYSAGDAAIYFNPYDREALVRVLKEVTQAEIGSPYREEVIQRGYKNVERFSHAALIPSWEALFTKLKQKATV
jgi:glycosyltransferase involved in cell wall biosynthesis